MIRLLKTYWYWVLIAYSAFNLAGYYCVRRSANHLEEVEKEHGDLVRSLEENSFYDLIINIVFFLDILFTAILICWLIQRWIKK
ncbi:hypothetical protein DRF59_16010 [Chryseobacterium flavum]|uniref:Uncharacterized protein n=1 Tax=Chryseobacterium flavum TaxID=415851 RepID=A0A3D9CIA2_9FLAO|nr:hypothetical protein [Chryseobacterium flavum]REC65454.1 hypothetical protein DRF59_16010 [Chryseobacterium flavum]